MVIALADRSAGLLHRDRPCAGRLGQARALCGAGAGLFTHGVGPLAARLR